MCAYAKSVAVYIRIVLPPDSDADAPVTMKLPEDDTLYEQEFLDVGGGVIHSYASGQVPCLDAP